MVWENIEMQGLGLVFKSLETLSCHFTSKMLHGWLNSGHQHAKFRKNPFLSLCPCCQHPGKTFENILQCKAPLKAGQRPLLETALQNQDKIGGDYAMREYLSTSWVDLEYYANMEQHQTALGSPGSRKSST
jgi:hypothetical protein